MEQFTFENNNSFILGWEKVQLHFSMINLILPPVKNKQNRALNFEHFSPIKSPFNQTSSLTQFTLQPFKQSSQPNGQDSTETEINVWKKGTCAIASFVRSVWLMQIKYIYRTMSSSCIILWYIWRRDFFVLSLSTLMRGS